MAYTLTSDPNTIMRDEDGHFIPTDPDNVDYVEYLQFLEEGGVPNPAPNLTQPSPEERLDG